MNRRVLYFFSGLGADERMFQRIQLPDWRVVHIKWVEPEKNQSLQAYAAKLLEQIPTPEPVLIGLSFGGMVAVEVAKLIPTSKIILISSAKTKSEIPSYFRYAGYWGLHRILPIRWMKRSNRFVDYLFGVQYPDDRSLLREALNNTNSNFLTWAIHSIVTWKNESIPHNTFHLHGSSDRILPAHYIRNAIVINKGGHLMVLNMSEVIQNHISTILSL